MRKVIVWIAGGLGNQLFQYAAARSVANDLQADLILDTAFFIRNRKRKYKLDAYNIKGRKTNLQEFLSIKFPQYLGDKMNNYIKTGNLIKVDESTLNTIQSNPEADIYMRGYWQNEKYFIKYRKELLDELSLRIKLPTRIRSIAEKLSNEQSVSIHVRRGDYFTDKVVNSTFGVLSLDYYQNAIQIIQERVKQPRFYIFSDDIKWTEENFFPGIKKEFVNLNGNNKDVCELWLMKHCRHNIIANSSFSWWGAWANTHKDKIIIAPKKWVKQQITELDYIVPPQWIRIENEWI